MSRVKFANLQCPTCCCDVITIEKSNCAQTCCYPWCLLILYLSWQAHLSQWPLLSWCGWKKTPAPSAWLLKGEPTHDNLCLALSRSRLEDLSCVCVTLVSNSLVSHCTSVSCVTSLQFRRDDVAPHSVGLCGWSLSVAKAVLFNSELRDEQYIIGIDMSHTARAEEK